jgi:hypothetical protein
MRKALSGWRIGQIGLGCGAPPDLAELATSCLFVAGSAGSRDAVTVPGFRRGKAAKRWWGTVSSKRGVKKHRSDDISEPRFCCGPPIKNGGTSAAVCC